jgi:DNA-binding SARP family transcriptional activator
VGVDFRILGPLEVVDPGGRRLDLGTPRQRAVLAVLLVRLNHVVSIDRLIDELWGETPPSAATASLQAYVSNLRRALEPDRMPRAPAKVVVTEAPGYALRVAPDQVDGWRFERLAAEAHRGLERGDAVGALRTLDAALGVWRGSAYADFAYEPFAVAEIARLHELRSAAEEDRVESMLLIGDKSGALAALEPLIAAAPLRERLRALRMRVLYRSGRQAEALRAFDETRRLLAEELGVEPGRELQLLHRQMLEQDPALDISESVVWTTPAVTAPVRLSRPGPRPAFVGRVDALNRLRAAMEDAAAGRSRMVLVEGEPGIGKTRLGAELETMARQSGVPTCWGRCHDDEGAPPLWPWVQVLRALGVAESPSVHARPVLAALLPELGPAMHDDVAADAARFRLYDVVREAVDQAVADRPAIVILDDAHWADASSLRLLRFLAVELREAPVLIVVTFRNTEESTQDAFGDTLADIARQPAAERLLVTGLSEHAVADLLRLTTTIPEDAVGGIAANLHQRTSGNPFFITELIRLMESERRWDDGGEAVDVPVAVGDVIRRRIRRLPDDIQTVLGVAAVIGRRFELDVLAHACGLDTDRTLDVLEAALVTRVVVEEAPGRYRFAHALVTETLHHDLGSARRARLHGRVAAAIEWTARADLSPRYSELAHHYANATSASSEQALGYARLAAEQAASRLAYDEAVGQWRAALAALDHCGGGTPAVRTHLLFDLAAAQRSAGNLAAGTAVNDEALAVARRSNDPALMAEAALAFGEVGLWQVRRYGTVDEHVVEVIEHALRGIGDSDSVLRARLLTGLSVALYYRDAERARGLSLVRDAVAIARRLNEPAVLAVSLVELIVMLDALPDQADQLAAAAELAALATADLPREAASGAVLRVARVALASGDASNLEREVDEFAAQTKAARHPDELLWATWAQTSIAFLQDRLDDSERLAGEAFNLHQRVGIWGAHEAYALHMVLIWREQGRLTAMAPSIEPLLASWVHPNAAKLRATIAIERGAPEAVAVLMGSDPVPRSRDFTWLVDMCITAELAAAAELSCRHELYETLLPFHDRVVTMDATFICMGAASYYLGLLAASLGRNDDARHHLEHAVALNEAVGAIPWSRRARSLVASPRLGFDDHRLAALNRRWS